MISDLKNNIKNIPLSLKASIAYSMCSVLQNCIGLITVPLFTRMLTTEQYGQQTIYSSWSSLISIFITLNLAYGSFSTAMVKFEGKRDSYISAIQGICVMLSLLFLGLYFLFQTFFDTLFELPSYLIILMVFQILSQTSIQLWSGKKRFDYKYKSVVGLSLIMSILSPVCAYLFVQMTSEKGYALIMGNIVVSVIFGGFIFIINQIRGQKIFDSGYWKFALRFNIPLLIYYLSQMIFNQSDRIMISHMVGTGDAAKYGVAYNLAMIMTFVLSAINGSYVPWFYGKIKENKQEDNKKVSVMIASLLALMILFVIWYAPEIILIMAGEQYAEAIYVVAPVAMSLLLLFYVQLFINVEFYYEEKKLLVWASIGSAIVNVVLNYLLIPIFGFVAAGYTTLFSYLIFVICNYLAMKHILAERNLMDNMYDYKSLMALFVGFVLSSYLGVILYKSLITRLCITAVVVMVMFFNRNQFICIMKQLSGKEMV